ncbi:MAG: hypothetical protein Q9207_000279 [Kuettlingeria erythrocarpa]
MSAGCLSLSLCRVSTGSSLLPFLYYTRTIQSSARLCARAQRSFHTSSRRRREAIPFVDELGNLEPDRSSRLSGKAPIRYILRTQAAEDEDDYDASRPPRASTITASEKAVFDRIFKEISADASKKAAKEEDPLQDEFQDDQPTKSDAYGNLNAIFDEAIKALGQDSQNFSGDRGEAMQPDALPRDYETAIGNAVKLGGAVSGTVKRPDFALRPGEKDKALQMAVSVHQRKVLKMLRDARSDIEIWHVLESEVFSLIEQRDTLRRQAEKQEKAAKPKRGRGRPSKVGREASAATEHDPSLGAAKKTTQELEIEAILSSNYGDYCLAAMRHLCRRYPTSPCCMALLPNIKRLGPISHVLAASVNLYNEILFLLWKEYSDLHGMADLIIEMGNQGLESNQLTLWILRMVRNAKTSAITEDKPMKKWWDLYLIDEGYKRLTALARGVNREIIQAQVKRSVEKMQSEDMSDSGGVIGS